MEKAEVIKIKKKLGKQIKDIIQEQNLTMDEVASRSAVSKFILYKIFKGQGYEIDGLIKILNTLKAKVSITRYDK